MIALKEKNNTLLLIFFLFIFQFYIIFNLEIYSELYTIIKWYNSPLGIFDTLGMRILDDGTFKATYSFIYLLPVYLCFIFFKLFGLVDNTSLALSNFIVINTQLLLLILVSKKLFKSSINTLLLYTLFFIGTFMWTGLQRVYPHDTIILLILLKIIFPNLKFFLMGLMVYVDPVIGLFFVILFSFFYNYSTKKTIINNLSNTFRFSFMPIVFGLLLWIIPILYLQNLTDSIGSSSSIYDRIFGSEDPYFFSRIQVYTPFHYYLPLYIQSSFSSFTYGALPFAASNIITPIGLYLLYKHRLVVMNCINKKDLLVISGISLMIAYIVFALIFGQAAASHRFDYDQYFQAGLLFILIVIFSSNNIYKDKVFIFGLFYYFLVVLPYLLIQFTILRV